MTIILGSGNLENKKERAYFTRLKKDMSTEVTGMKTLLMDGVFRNGRMVRSTKASSRWMNVMDSVDGSLEKITDIKDSSRKECDMASANTTNLMDTATEVSGLMISDQEKDSKDDRTKIPTKALSWRISTKATVFTSSRKLKRCTEATSSVTSDKAKVH